MSAVNATQGNEPCERYKCRPIIRQCCPLITIDDENDDDDDDHVCLSPERRATVETRPLYGPLFGSLDTCCVAAGATGAGRGLRECLEELEVEAGGCRLAAGDLERPAWGSQSGRQRQRQQQQAPVLAMMIYGRGGGSKLKWPTSRMQIPPPINVTFN